jgi:hypothetical protein
MKRQKLIIDLEVESSCVITNANQQQITCSKMLVLNKGMKDRPHSSQAAGSSEEE